MDADVLAEGRPRPMTARAILLAMNIEEPLVWEEGNYESGEHFSIAPKEQLGLEACLTAYAAEIVAHRDMGWIGLNNGRELNRPLLLATLDYRSGRASSHQRYRFLHRVAADSFQIYEYEALGWGSD
jgi:hypothetical protein